MEKEMSTTTLEQPKTDASGRKVRKNLVLAVMSEYRYRSGDRDQRNESFSLTNGQLDAIYASGRLRLPFEGVLLLGY